MHCETYILFMSCQKYNSYLLYLSFVWENLDFCCFFRTCFLSYVSLSRFARLLSDYACFSAELRELIFEPRIDQLAHLQDHESSPKGPSLPFFGSSSSNNVAQARIEVLS